MSRYKAFALHLAASLVLILGIFMALRSIWYPGPLFHAAQASNLMQILIPVDVILGPILTLIIFKAGKRGLKFDLAIIFLAQASFLLYGLYSIYQVRPVYFALMEQNAYLITANAVEDENLAKAKDERYRKLPAWGPEWVFVKAPTDSEARSNDVLTNAIFGIGSQNLPELYSPLQDKQLQAAALPFERLKDLKPADHKKLLDYLEQHKGQKHGFIRLYTKTGPMFIAINMQDGKVAQLI
ncbi:hypothetical protein V8J88_19660 [Massilia sp. W12]|uniref:hypothetical protein n=1 Tax=Massilia sp. W12 TaxID=3126507 RepID=UPI0030D581E4